MDISDLCTTPSLVMQYVYKMGYNRADKISKIKKMSQQKDVKKIKFAR